jgi:diguanylate cyclase (GGDEF)-like protein
VRQLGADTNAVDPGARGAAGRQAAVLLVAAGIITVLDAPLAPRSGGRPGVLAVVGVSSVVAGVVAWLLPWKRWPERTLLVLVAAAFVLIGTGNTFGDSDPYTYAVYFVLVFAWIGLHQPVGTALVIAPVAIATYVAPLVWSPLHLGGDWTSVLVVAPVCVLVGETIARGVAAMRHSRNLDNRRVGDLEAIVGAASLLQAESDPRNVGPTLARVATSILHGEDAVVLLEDGEGRRLSAGVHSRTGDPGTVALPPLDAVDQALRDGQPIYQAGTLVVPLRGADRVVGAVAVRLPDGVRPDAFAVHAAQLVGSQAGLALEQQRVIDELTEAALQDPLTGVGNRRRAAVLLEALRADDAVVLIDLDQFKLVNDTTGHAAGDRVLVLLGRYLREEARDADAIARYGGEEFLLVLRGAGDSASAAIERLLEGWRELRPLTTFSAGVAVHQSGRSPAATLGRADAALYKAKRGGRDRVCEDGADTTV